MALESGDEDQAPHIAALFRAVHTFKGNSRVLGLGVVESRAHLSEDLIGLVRDDGVPLDKEILDLLFYAGDTLRSMLEEVASTHQDVDPGPSEDLQAQLRQLIEKHKGAPVEDPLAAKMAQLDELDALSASDEPDEEASEEVEPVEEPQEPEDTEVEDTVAQEDDVAQEAAPAPASGGNTMALDPVYQKIFTGMAGETADQLDALTSDASLDDEAFAKKAKNKASSLSYAASKLSLETWVASADAFVAKIDAMEPKSRDAVTPELTTFVADIRALLETGFSETGPAPEAVPEKTEDETIIIEPVDEEIDVSDVEEIDETELYEDKVAFNMAIDPVYQKIFTGMAQETIDQLSALGSDADLDDAGFVKKVLNKAASLSYAADQLALTTWTGELDAFETQVKVNPNATRSDVQPMLDGLIGTLRSLLEAGFDEVSDEFVEEEVTDQVVSAEGQSEEIVKKKVKRVTPVKIELPDERYVDIFNLVATFDTRLTSGEHTDESELQDLADKVSRYCEKLGFTRAADVASRLNSAKDIEKFRATQLKFFEEIASIEDLLPDEDLDNVKLPSELLNEWCSDNIDDTLDQILDVLNAFVKEKEHGQLFRRYDRLVRQCYHTCQHYKMATGVHLALALVDLFSRAWQSGSAPAAMTLRLSFSFVDKTRPIFQKKYSGEDCDLDPLDRIFEEALTAIYAQNGTVSAKTVEKRLGLPEVFRNILSPESVSTAMTSIQNGMRFYILRTDLQNDEDTAQRFFDWIRDSGVRMITNVTIFQDDDVLFDFLIAANIAELDLVEQLSTIDETGELLYLQSALVVEADPDNPDPDQALIHTAEYAANEQVMKSTLSMVEAIGEISAGQAMVQHMLSNLSNQDLLLDIDTALREAGITEIDPAIRTAVRRSIDGFTQKLKSAAEAEVQLSEQLAQLQQESVAVRSRSADHLLRQLSFFVVSTARKKGAVARTFTVGADVVLDQMVMENLRKMIEPILEARLSVEPIPSDYHISIQSEGDRATVVIEDDGSAAIDPAVFELIEARILKDGGELRIVTLPDRGVRFHVTMPLHMIVLDGMVVRVGEVNYVIPIDAILRIQQSTSSAVLEVSAGDGQSMLEVGADQHVPIHRLSGRPTEKSSAVKGHSTQLQQQLNTFVIVRNEEFQMAIPVDELMGQQLVLLRPLRGVLSRMRHLSGVALLAGGEVGMVLAVNRVLAA